MHGSGERNHYSYDIMEEMGESIDRLLRITLEVAL